ncbi:Cytochrome P450 monooxygenase -like protein [Cladobotryum mycophilum]|uniref:Cytochrome P450 monooxygenase -like protein n=1 Tax=Cladobotryum mycophilum TaxID=491253 RepID=A0ABR0SQ92_9HYPO
MTAITSTLAAGHNWAITALVLLLTPIILLLVRSVYRPPLALGTGWSDKGWPFIGSLRFFSARGDYFVEGKQRSPNGYFNFYCGNHSIVALSGEAARTCFYTIRGLDLNAGFRVLYALGPDLNDILGRNASSYFNLLFKRFASTANLGSVLSYFHRDINACYEKIDTSKPVEPFEFMYPLVYKLTHRTLGCHDIADDPKLAAKTLKLFEPLDTNSTFQIIFPSLPTFQGLKKFVAGTRLHLTLSKIVADRKKTGRSNDDAMQVMIDNGDSNMSISMFIMGGLFAGFFNTGVIAAWVLAHIAADDEWYGKMRAEVDAAIAKHRLSDDETPVDILQRLSIDEWESEFSLIDLGLRETIRIRLPGATVRRNISGKDLVLGNTGVVVPKDGFTMYALADAHLDSSIYKDPLKWDPSRYLPERAEDKKVAHAYIGWGSGLQPCLGIKLAKLEVAVITATFFAYFDFNLCDKNGNAISQLPAFDRNELQPKPPLQKVYLKCTPRSKV